jgi:hypothetical protein
MTIVNTNILRVTLATIAGMGALLANDISSTKSSSWVSCANATIGRPLTPMSYAGVARRTTRRAYYGAGAVAVGAAAVAAPRCAQVVDAYGRIVTRCY